MVSPLFGLGVAALRADPQTLARELFGYFTRPIEGAVPGLGMSVRAVGRALGINESTLRSSMTRGDGIPSEALAGRILEATRGIMSTPALPEVAQRLASMTASELERASRGAGARDVLSVGMANSRQGDRTRTTTYPEPVLADAVRPHSLASDTQIERLVLEWQNDLLGPGPATDAVVIDGKEVRGGKLMLVNALAWIPTQVKPVNGGAPW